MNKKTVFIILPLLFFSLNIFSTSISFGPGYYNFSGDVKEIYSGSNVFFTGELSFNIKVFDVFLTTNLCSYKGKLSYTKEDTTLKLTQLESGIKFPFGKKTSPYIGAGLEYTFYKESNKIGEASGSGVGYFAIAGLKINMKKIFFDLRAKYTMLKINGVDLSGLSAILLFGISF